MTSSFGPPNSQGIFTVKSTYHLSQLDKFQQPSPLTSQEWKHLWKLKMHERLKLLLWKISWDALPTKEALNRRWPQSDLNCVLYKHPIESLENLIIHCPFTITTFSQFAWPLNISKFGLMDTKRTC